MSVAAEQRGAGGQGSSLDDDGVGAPPRGRHVVVVRVRRRGRARHPDEEVCGRRQHKRGTLNAQQNSSVETNTPRRSAAWTSASPACLPVPVQSLTRVSKRRLDGDLDGRKGHRDIEVVVSGVQGCVGLRDWQSLM